MEKASSTDKTILKVLWLFKQEEARFFDITQSFLSIGFNLLSFLYSKSILLFGTIHGSQLPVILSLSDIFYMDWQGHVPFLPSFVWLLLNSELIIKLYRWFHCFSDAFSFPLHCYYFWLLVGFSHVMESLPLFSDFSPLVISFPNNWSVYLAMPNIRLPSCLPRLPCRGVQP